MTEALDIFCHWLPPEFLAAALDRAGRRLHMLARAARMRVMVDLDARFRVMDEFPGYRQVPSLASPPIEALAGPGESPDIARRANDEMAELVARHADRFAGFVAALPLNDPDASLAEAERAVRTLSAAGVQVFTHVNGRPLDTPEILPLFGTMAVLDRPVWLHPIRGINSADYPGETFSRYDLWWALGWPYETGLAMGRLVFAGVFERWPGLKVITHHAGGIVPMLEGRLGAGLDMLGTRSPPPPHEAAAAHETSLRERPLDAFRRFYADTASFGSRATIECARSFFGADRLLFATDMPFDPEGGPGFIRSTLRILDDMCLSGTERTEILAQNARRLLALRL